MVYLSVVIVAFLTIIGSTICEPRSSRLKSYLQAKGRTENQGNCFQAFDECSKSEKCRAALRGLDKRCKVISGRCGAEMVDLTRCGQIMDHIFSFGFPEERCSCPEDSKGCNTMLNKVYSNPCFTSIRHLRKNGLFPEEINAYDRVSGIKFTTTQSPLTTALRNRKSAHVDEEESKLALFEEVFGDKKVVRKTTYKKSKIAAVVEHTNKVLRPSEEKSKALPQSNPRKEVTASPRFKAEQTAHLQKAFDDYVKRLMLSDEREEKVVETRKSSDELPRETDGPVEGRSVKENTDFRSIAIILAILLGILVSGATIFLVCARLRTAHLYKSAKLVQDQRSDEEIHPKAQLSSMSSSDDAV